MNLSWIMDLSKEESGKHAPGAPIRTSSEVGAGARGDGFPESPSEEGEEE